MFSRCIQSYDYDDCNQKYLSIMKQLVKSLHIDQLIKAQPNSKELKENQFVENSKQKRSFNSFNNFLNFLLDLIFKKQNLKKNSQILIKKIRF